MQLLDNMTQPPTTEDLLASLNKQLPYDDDTEQAILSCLLQRPSLCDEAPHAEIMYHEANRIILTTIISLFAAGKPIDQISLTHALRNANKLTIVGGPAFISELFTLIPSASNYQYYLTILRDKFAFRQMIGAMAAGIAHLQAFQEADGVSATDAIQHVTKLVCEAVNDDSSADLPCRQIGELLTDVLNGIEERCANPGKIPGISTGFAGFDKYLGGLEDGRLTVIAGESSDGKSCLARQFVESACLQDHVGVIYTYEMRDTEEAGRLICSQAGIDSSNLKHGMLTRVEHQSIGVKTMRLSKWPISIVDVAGKTIEQICRDIARRSKRLKQGQKLVASIDYIQLCLTSKTNGGNREREVAHITATAKQCAKMTGAHIIMPSQLNEDGKVRESRAIEQDSDNLIIIQKPFEKQAKAWEKKKEDEPNYDRNLFIKKNRNGERLKIVKATLNGRFFRFDPAREE
jgi:replicative DNA helicase